MNRNLLILGAGQYGFVAKEIAESMECFDQIDFLDDANETAIDCLSAYRAYVDRYSQAIVAIGTAERRLHYIRGLADAGFRVASLVSPRAYVAPSAKTGIGAVVEPMAVINANARMGIGVIVCAGAIVNHDATVGDGCLLQCGSIIVSGTAVPKGTKTDYGAVFQGTADTLR